MTEDPDQSPEEPKKEEQPDLESLLGGFDLTPGWAKGDSSVTTSPSRERSGGDRRGGGGPRAPRTSGRNMQGVRVKPRRDMPNQGSGGGGHGGGHGGGGRPSQGRSDHRGGGRPYQERAPRVPVHVDFIPEKKRLSKVVKVIRQSHRVYPLQVVAEKFMENPGFIAMKYTVREKEEGAKDFHLFVCRANGMVFTDEQACIQYVVEHGLQASYETDEKTIDPPSGNFVCIGRHRKSGRLIGPPNWHGYQARMIAVKAEVAEGIPLEVFQSDIEMVHDEEAIDAWKKEVSVETFYRKKLEEKKPDPKAEEPKAEEPVAEPEESDKSDVSDMSDVSDPPAAPAPEAEPEPEAEAPTPEAEAPEAEPEPEPEPEPETPEEPAVDDRPFDLTREQAEAEFRENYLSRLVGRTKRTILPGYLYDKMTDPSLLSLTDYHLRREHNRPSSIIFALRPAFKHMRLHVFRFNGELMVSGIDQHPLPEDQKVTPEIQSIVDFVAANPGCNTQEALKSVSNTVDEIPAETVSHFRWLIEKGHVLELHDDTLHLPHKRGGGGGKKPAAPSPKPETPSPKPDSE